MYGIEYEDDILLLLRMIKFLHMQSPDAAHIFAKATLSLIWRSFSW